MKAYLEITVPLNVNAPWLKGLDNALKDFHVNWKPSKYCFHFTLVFIEEVKHNDAVMDIMKRFIDDARPVTINFDKLDVFKATNKGELIVNMTASNIPEAFDHAVKTFRNGINEEDAKISKDFRYHVTLGSIKDPNVDIDEVKSRISKFRFAPITLQLKTLNYKKYEKGNNVIYSNSKENRQNARNRHSRH